jgi:diadenosine tetraphosphate (Ap4A) HIT family hydrolase
MRDCIFCDLRNDSERPVLASTLNFIAVRDKYPVNTGHTLLIPFRHVTRVGDFTAEEWTELWSLLRKVQELLRAEGAQGFNIGINEGEAAGQTIEHFHVHIIPRFVGDVERPRGGIRNLKRAEVEY